MSSHGDAFPIVSSHAALFQIWAANRALVSPHCLSCRRQKNAALYRDNAGACNRVPWPAPPGHLPPRPPPLHALPSEALPDRYATALDEHYTHLRRRWPATGCVTHSAPPPAISHCIGRTVAERRLAHVNLGWSVPRGYFSTTARNPPVTRPPGRAAWRRHFGGCRERHSA